MTIEITRPEVEAMIRERLESGRFKDAEDVVREALVLSPKPPRKHTQEERSAAINSLMTFARDHGISLGDMTLEELREEARP